MAPSYLPQFRHVAEYVDVPYTLLLTVCQLLVVLPLMPGIQECIAHFAAVQLMTIGLYEVGQVIPCVVVSYDT